MSTLVKGLLLKLNNEIKIRGKEVPHMILHTGDDKMWVETKGYNNAIEPLTISYINTFYTEDKIRELISNKDSRPDILVCTSEIDSICAYHAMVDYNLVGNFQMIGYYQSDTMLDAIEKGTVPMAITMNAQQIGASSVEALEEYYDMGHVSDYHTVNLSIITQSNVQQFREAE